MIINKKEILNYLDERFDNIEMPCFGNMNIDYVTSQLSVYVNPEGLWQLPQYTLVKMDSKIKFIKQ